MRMIFRECGFDVEMRGADGRRRGGFPAGILILPPGRKRIERYSEVLLASPGSGPRRQTWRALLRRCQPARPPSPVIVSRERVFRSPAERAERADRYAR